MPKIIRLTVEKGKTVQVGERKWRKTTYGLEADVSDVPNQDELEKLRLELAFKLDDWLQQEQHATTSPSGKVDVSAVPDIDLAELDECPWQTFQRKPARKGQAAWIKNPEKFDRFDAPPVLRKLAEALMTLRGEPLILGDMKYVLSGEDKFIQRKSVKRGT